MKRKDRVNFIWKIVGAIFIVGMILGCGILHAFGADQIITLTPSNTTPAPGSSFSVKVSYNTSDNDNTLNGIGFNVHYNGTLLQYDGYSDFFGANKLSDPTNLADSSNLDADASTDHLIRLSYADFVGGNWPNQPLPLDLVVLNFTVKPSAPFTSNANFNGTRQTTHTGYTFVGNNSTITVTPGSLVSISVTPDTANLVAGQTQAFTVTGEDEYGNTIANPGGITWSVNGAIGNISDAGLFTATTAGIGTVTATVGSISDTSGTITVSPGALTTLSVTPVTANLIAGQTQEFAVTGQDAYGNAISDPGAITWSVSGTIGNNISTGGVFTASTAGTGTVTATVGSISGSSGVITVMPGPLATLTVSPDTADLTAGQTQAFSATGVDAYGNAIANPGAITWSVSGAIGNNISAAGLFTATTAGTGTVIATIGSISDSSGIVAVMPGALASLTVDPNTATLTADETQMFTVIGKDTYGNTIANPGAITWSVSGTIGNNISAAGLFTATAAGTGTVTATIGSISGTSGTITVTPGALASLTVDPNTATLTADETQVFTVIGKDANGNTIANPGAITWSVSGTIGNNISAAGLFTATTAGTGTVTATIGNISGTSGTITVTPGALASLTVDPNTATLTADETQVFTVIGKDADGNTISNPGAITWSVSGAIGNNISAAGLFTATTAGTGTVTATIGSISGTSGTITVTPGAPSKLVLSTDRTKVASGGKSTANLTAILKDQNNNVITGDTGTSITFTATGADTSNVGWPSSAASGNTTSGETTVVFTTQGTVAGSGTVTVNVTATGGGFTSNQINLDIVNFSALPVASSLVTTGNPNQTTITAVGAGAYAWSIVSGNGQLSGSGETVTFTAPPSIIEGTAGHSTVIRVADASDSQVNYEFTIKTYEPVRYTAPSEAVGITHNGNIKTFQLLAAGGDGNYTYAVNGPGGIISVSPTGLVTGNGLGTATVYVWDSNGAQGTANDFRAESASIDVLNAVAVAPVPPNSLEASTSQQFNATGGKGAGYTWQIDNASAGSISNAGLFQAGAVGALQNATITAADSTYPSIFGTTQVTVYPEVKIADKPAETIIIEPGKSTQEFKVTGGDGSYTWSVAGPVAVAGGSGNAYTFTAPDQGDFAGEYTISVSDGNGFMETFTVYVPITITPTALSFTETKLDLSPNPITFTVRGASSGLIWEILGSAGAAAEVSNPAAYGQWSNGKDVQAGNTNDFVANAADVNTVMTFFVRVMPQRLQPRVVGPFHLIPVESFTVRLMDGEQPIDGSLLNQGEILVIEQVTGQRGSLAADDGTVTIDLPASGGTFRYEIEDTRNPAVYIYKELSSTERNVNVAMSRIGSKSIAGTVISAVDQQALPGVEVTAYLPTDPMNMYSARTDQNGFYEVLLPVGAPIEGWTVIAGNPMGQPPVLAQRITGQTTQAPVDFELPAKQIQFIDAAGGFEQLVLINQVVEVEIPPDGFTVHADLTIEDEVNPGGQHTKVSPGYVYEIFATRTGTQIPLTEAEVNWVLIKLPIDLAADFPGGHEVRNWDIQKAKSLDELAKGRGIVVPREKVLATDYIGDGKIGSIAFWVDSLSFFSLGLMDTEKPVITMLGTSPIEVTRGSDYVDAGATAFDNFDGDITSKIVVVNNVDRSIEGTYTVTYNVTDDAGNAAIEVIRVVNVVAPSVVIPEQPVLVSPINQSVLDTRTPTLQAGPFSDPTGHDHLLSHWQVGTDIGFDTGKVLVIESEKSLTSLKIPDMILKANQTYFWRVMFVNTAGEESNWSEVSSFSTPVEMKDPDEDKYRITSYVDLDGNGVDDKQQTDIKSVKTIVETVQVGVKKSTGVLAVEEVKPVDPKQLSEEGRPVNMPYGLVSFRLSVAPGDEAQVVVYFSQPIPVGMKWYKYNPANGWYDFPNAVFSDDRMSVTLKLKDGEPEDADGIVNGIIIDPSGPGGATLSGGKSSSCFIETAKSGSTGYPGLLMLILAAVIGTATLVSRRYIR